MCSIYNDYPTLKKNVEQYFGDVRDYECRPDVTDEKVSSWPGFSFDYELIFFLVK